MNQPYLNMNRLSYLTLLMCLPLTTIHAAEPSRIKRLTTETITAEPAHLTTRIQWIKYPHLQYKIEELAGQDRSAIIRIQADKTGHVVGTTVQESTGVKALDQKLIAAVSQAKIKPHLQNGTAQSVIGYQNFTLKLKDSADQANARQPCVYHFDSANWLRQQQNKSVPFSYRQQPQLQIHETALKNSTRVVKVKFRVNKQGEVTHVKLKKRSGVNAIDQQVIEALSHSQVQVNRTAATLWLYKKSTLSDEIQFKAGSCQ
ncbi:TonB family protein [Acinetobacter sp. WZC-1]|uniref:TonB family protein n=1 Tax=Acinetobacter sp. WZC-1 TaxID=3459034 RepID=UPI00403DE48E